MINRQFANSDDAYRFLAELGASTQLLLHVRLVGEAADIIIEKLLDLNVMFNADFVRLGVIFHDVGKILHPQELSEKGNLHEIAGEKLLSENGVDKKLARCCQSHGKWKTFACSFEEYLIALADKLWKGKRENDLENLVIDKVTDILNQARWDVFMELDLCFEQIAAAGDSRLMRSRNY
jgi:HD domain